ncbi:MAG: class I SAM-dependent methyltransferase [Acidimicrobiales bacterium]
MSQESAAVVSGTPAGDDESLEEVKAPADHIEDPIDLLAVDRSRDAVARYGADVRRLEQVEIACGSGILSGARESEAVGRASDQLDLGDVGIGIRLHHCGTKGTRRRCIGAHTVAHVRINCVAGTGNDKHLIRRRRRAGGQEEQPKSNGPYCPDACADQTRPLGDCWRPVSASRPAWSNRRLRASRRESRSFDRAKVEIAGSNPVGRSRSFSDDAAGQARFWVPSLPLSRSGLASCRHARGEPYAVEILATEYIVDAVPCRVGEPATVAKISSGDDLRQLLSNILDTGYYDTAYFARQTGLKTGLLTMNLWFVASLVAALRPRRSIELGAGKGDVVEMLRRRGIDAWGLDSSPDMWAQLSPIVREAYVVGDVAEMQDTLSGERFDTVLGFDIWEHLLPETITDVIDQATAVMTEDGMCVSIIPAFGPDPVFGEIFPLEFEENRERFDAGLPFDHITLERSDPPIPAAGHLVWAPGLWWEAQFEAAGLVREPSIERRLHAIFDPYLAPSNRCFFVYRRDTPQARARAAATRRRLRRPAVAARYLDLFRLARAESSGEHRFAVPPLDYVADRHRVLGSVQRVLRVVRPALGQLRRRSPTR